MKGVSSSSEAGVGTTDTVKNSVHNEIQIHSSPCFMEKHELEGSLSGNHEDQISANNLVKSIFSDHDGSGSMPSVCGIAVHTETVPVESDITHSDARMDLSKCDLNLAVIGMRIESRTIDPTSDKDSNEYMVPFSDLPEDDLPFGSSLPQKDLRKCCNEKEFEMLTSKNTWGRNEPKGDSVLCVFEDKNCVGSMVTRNDREHSWISGERSRKCEVELQDVPSQRCIAGDHPITKDATRYCHSSATSEDSHEDDEDDAGELMTWDNSPSGNNSAKQFARRIFMDDCLDPEKNESCTLSSETERSQLRTDSSKYRDIIRNFDLNEELAPLPFFENPDDGIRPFDSVSDHKDGIQSNSSQKMVRRISFDQDCLPSIGVEDSQDTIGCNGMISRNEKFSRMRSMQPDFTRNHSPGFTDNGSDGAQDYWSQSWDLTNAERLPVSSSHDSLLASSPKSILTKRHTSVLDGLEFNGHSEDGHAKAFAKSIFSDDVQDFCEDDFPEYFTCGQNNNNSVMVDYSNSTVPNASVPKQYTSGHKFEFHRGGTKHGMDEIQELIQSAQTFSEDSGGADGQGKWHRQQEDQGKISRISRDGVDLEVTSRQAKKEDSQNSHYVTEEITASRRDDSEWRAVSSTHEQTHSIDNICQPKTGPKTGLRVRQGLSNFYNSMFFPRKSDQQ